MEQDCIVIEQYTKILKGRPVLSDVNLTLERGGVYGLFGHNGSGKTMLLRAIAGLIVPTRGGVTVFGERLGKKQSFPSSMGLIIENVGFWPAYTGLENLKVLAAVKKTATEDDLRRAMERVGLDPADKRTYRKYSLGMRQRLGIAQAVMERPDLLLLDEPTNGLDDDGVEQFHQIIAEERERGATIVMASHIKDELRQQCDRCYRVDNGTVREEEFA